jgi:hypothetical protein
MTSASRRRLAAFHFAASDLATWGLTALRLVAGILVCLPQVARAAGIAATPPMGWNSYDAYGTTVTEAQFRANARWMSRHLARYGWQYVVIDEEWYVPHSPPSGSGSPGAVFVLDKYGRYVPAPERFPSAANGAGFKPLADYVHSLGLKFGFHILRGIPREAVARNLPIEGSPYTAAQAADVHSTCPWNPDNYGVDLRGPAGQAYYNSMARLYASWGVDFIKADCIASHPYAGEEIRMLSTALAASGRDMVLSLSPGPAPIAEITAFRRYSNMWRMSNDVWDLWHDAGDYPKGVGDQFEQAARWAPLAEPGHWPDADMLALGYLGPFPGLGKPRETRLTHAEQRTYLTLWCIARSPLFLGGNLTRTDRWTEGLLDDPEVIAVDQHASHAHQALARDGFIVWLSEPESGGGWYLAAFNTQPQPRKLTLSWPALALPAARYAVRDLWQRRDRGVAATLSVHLDAHGAALYRLQPR